MNKCTSFAFFVLCAVSVNAGPIAADSAASKGDVADKTSKEFVSMNKTFVAAAAEKAKSTIRPSLITVPVYPQPLLGSPSLRFQRVGLPIVLPRFGMPNLGHRLGDYSGYQQQPQMYSSYIQPSAPTAYASPIGYQHQPLIPSTYNYAPYASNSYSSYGYRSAAEDEKLQQPLSMDQPLQSTVQYETKYIMKPQDYPADQPQLYAEYNSDNVEYAVSTPSEMQPREMLWPASPIQNEMGLQRRYETIMGADDRISSMNYVAPMSDPTAADKVFWEEYRRPYVGSYPEHHVSPQLDNYRLTEPSGRYLPLTRPYGNLMNWENAVAYG